MNKTRIEWCDASLNPIKGLCPMDCKDNQGNSYCYARRMYQRFHWNYEIRLDDSVLYGLPKEPMRIFVGSTMELFGNWVKMDWFSYIAQSLVLQPQHTYIFLTKRPQVLGAYYPYIKEFWVGASATNQIQYLEAIKGLAWADAKIKFISFEPLLNNCYVSAMDLQRANIRQVIIGQQTPSSAITFPDILWVKNIVDEADKAGCAVFIKNNMKDLMFTEGIKYKALDWALDNQGRLRQEFPK